MIIKKKQLVQYIRYYPLTGEFKCIHKNARIRKDSVIINSIFYKLINVASMLMTGDWNVRNIYFITDKYNYVWENLQIGKCDYFLITADNIKEYLYYNPNTGIFRWAKDMGKFWRNKGDIAGYVNNQGYTQISIYQDDNSAHRLAILYITGAWPKKGMVVDHINEIRHDNRWCNLRVVSQGDNVKFAIENFRKRLKNLS